MMRRRRTYWAIGLLMLFLSYQASVVSFTHVHIINGVTIAHSHPFTSEHQHSGSQYFQLELLSHFLSPEMEVPVVGSPDYRWVLTVEVIPEYATYSDAYFNILSLRAPPCLA